MKHLLLTTIAAVLLVGCGKPSNPEADRVLIDAVKQGNIEAVKYRLAIGTDIELKCTGCGGTALFHAAELENKVVVELLIKAGAEVDAKDDGGRTPLFAAIYFGQKENAELLIANGADVNAETTSGMSLLDMALSKKHEELINLIKASGGSSNADQSIHVASNIGDLRAVKKHLDAGSDVNARDDRTGGTPLHCAVAFGHKETAELLIAEGADVNAKDNQSGNTPLHTAARNGRKEIGELLTEHGADVNAKNDDGMTPLGRAIEYRQIKIANFLRKNGSKMGETTKIKAPNISIYQAAEHGRIDAVKYYLAAGVDVNVKMKNILGTTPLHEAVRKNRKEIVELLIAEGANVNARDGSGETALYQAAHRGYLELCKLLINNGADLDISTSKITMGHSPLYFAIRNRHADVAELLITSGADVNIKNGFGESPMDMAVHAKLQNIVNLLIEHGAETSALKGKEKTNETAKPTAFTHMPEIDLSSLPEEQRKTILERANKEGCNCGCKMTVAECRNDDTTCRRSVALAKAIVKEVTGEKLEEEVKSEAGKTGEELKAEGK